VADWNRNHVSTKQDDNDNDRHLYSLIHVDDYINYMYSLMAMMTTLQHSVIGFLAAVFSRFDMFQ